MPVQKKKISQFLNWLKSFKFLSRPSRLKCSQQIIPENSEATSVKLSICVWLQTPKCKLPLCGPKLSLCFCGLIKKHSCKRVFPLFSKNFQTTMRACCWKPYVSVGEASCVTISIAVIGSTMPSSSSA